MKQQITIRLPDELKKEIQQQADQKNISFNAEIILLIHRGLEDQSYR